MLYIYYMKIAITGSRTWTNAQKIDDELEKLEITELLHGGAEGADQMAAAWATLKGVKVTEIKPNYTKNGPAAPHIRNADLVKLADQVLAFWDGKSKGTGSTIAKAKRAGKLLKIVPMENEKPTTGDEQLKLW